VGDEMGDETVSSNGEPDTKEAEAFVDALNHSAERVQTLWFSFLTFMLYLAIATGTTTHRMLFLEEPLNLPVLNIKLPLLGFYVLTPIIFVVLHFYMLLNLVLLARTAKTFEDVLERTFPEDGPTRENFRMHIENTLFVQLLVGGRLDDRDCASNECTARAERHHILHRLGVHGLSFSIARPSGCPQATRA
jgi:hypothetical protein